MPRLRERSGQNGVLLVFGMLRFRKTSRLALIEWPLWLAGVYFGLFDPYVEGAPFAAAAGTITIIRFIEKYVAPVSRAYRTGYRDGFEHALAKCSHCRSEAEMPEPDLFGATENVVRLSGPRVSLPR